MESSTLTLWTGPFPIESRSSYFILLPCFIEIPVFNAYSVDSEETPLYAVPELVRCHLMRRLIWSYSVCQCPLYGTVGINGLMLNLIIRK